MQLVKCMYQQAVGTTAQTLAPNDVKTKIWRHLYPVINCFIQRFLCECDVQPPVFANSHANRAESRAILEEVVKNMSLVRQL